eukprot:gene1958-2226_t
MKDILYFDATGSLIEKVKGFKRILLYSLTTRNPFGKTPAVPLAEMISASHTAPAIKRLFAMLGEEETTLYGENIKPLSNYQAIRTDFTLAIISACAEEFNGITTDSYLESCYNILTTRESAGNRRLTVLLLCTAHVMKGNAKNDERHITRCCQFV